MSAAVKYMLRDAGCYTAYKRKWHLTKEFETVNKLGTPRRIFTQEMEDYAFSDYFGLGDIIAHTRGRYLHHGVIASMATSWLRGKGRDLATEGKPWFLTTTQSWFDTLDAAIHDGFDDDAAEPRSHVVAVTGADVRLLGPAPLPVVRSRVRLRRLP